MPKVAIISLLSLSLLGCVMNSAPKGNLPFSSSTRPQDLSGVYKNQGTPQGMYLSQLIWEDRSHPVGKDEKGRPVIELYVAGNSGSKLQDKDIELIEVVASEKVVTVNAVRGTCIAATKTFEVGKDLIFTDGRIIIRRETHLLSRGAGDVLVGPSYEKAELGLDTKGDGKYSSQGIFAGLVFMFLPMAAGGTDEVRFERIPGAMNFQLCK